MNTIIRPAQRLIGKPVIPGDKSISHRALIFGALAKGQTKVIDVLESGDVQSTARCLRQLGVGIERSGNITYVQGNGGAGFSSPGSDLDCGNSGTTMRLLMGALAGVVSEGRPRFSATFTGDDSLKGRPMKRIVEPLRLMGAEISLENDNYAPATLWGAQLQGIPYELKIASAQIKSALILAALSARGITVLSGKLQSRDHTERLLRSFGVQLQCNDKTIQIEGGQTLQGATVEVPGDPSSAAFWLAAATLVPDSCVRLEKISLNPTRLGFLNVLQRIGGVVETEMSSDSAEPIGRIIAKSGSLVGTHVSKGEIPSLIDEIPLIAVLATQAKGVTEIEGAEELRVKESDRLEAIAANLRAMGVVIELRKDGFRIEGPQKLTGARIQTYRDHRIAMAFSIAGLIAEGSTEILDADCVEISYPSFFATLETLTK